MNNWTDKYIAIPYLGKGSTLAGCDCWGLVELIYRNELGVELPNYMDVPHDNLIKINRKIQSEVQEGYWKKIVSGQEKKYDIILMRGQFKDSQDTLRSAPIHVGIVIDCNLLLHVEEGANSVCCNYSTHPKIKERVHGFYRYQSA